MISHLCHITYGTDPEGFFATTDGKIVGAEKVLPKTGIGDAYCNKIVLDGVQFEMHPYYAARIEDLGYRMSQGFKTLVDHLKRQKADQFKIDFTQVVKVDEDELKTLSTAARTLGCQPSENFYRKRPIKVPPDFPVRSAAGHFHIGLGSPIYTAIGGSGVDYRRRLVPLLDIFVGNTCVLLDRDPLAAERRKLYGHAGEYRKPSYGLEYRTVSNFWLKSYALMELVFGLANTAVQVLATTISNESAKLTYLPERILAEKIKIKNVEKAIEQNDADLAWKNWETLAPFFKEHVPNLPSFPIHYGNVDRVTKFLKIAAEDGLKDALPADPVAHWLSLTASEQSLYRPLPRFEPTGNRWVDLFTKVLKSTEATK